MAISPTAMGMEVVPMEALWMALPIWGQITRRHAYGHGQENPESQESVKKGKTLHVFFQTRRSTMDTLSCSRVNAYTGAL